MFSHAYLLSGDPAFGEAARHGIAFLMRAARAPDGGWFRAVSVDGATLDNTRDTYDHAFVLFALAWYFRATGDCERDPACRRHLGVDAGPAGGSAHGGFFEEFAPGRTELKLPRRQNPHMHLLEALLALHVATGEKNWLRRAGALVDLFKRRFVDPRDRRADRIFCRGLAAGARRRGSLARAGTSVRMGLAAARVYRLTRDESVMPYADRLFAFGTQFGIERGDGLGAVFDGVDANGALVAGTKLLWPQTEYLKACVARAEWHDDSASARRDSAHLALIAQSFMRPDGANWHNQLARDGTPLTPATPARVLYHLFLAWRRRIGCSIRALSPASAFW